MAAGVDADADRNLPPLQLEPGDLRECRAAHPLSQVFPLLYDVLGRVAEDCDCVMAVGDALGQLLWVCGTPGVLREAAAINFAEGTVWDEAHAGTNAPGPALQLDAPVQIHAAEHFNRLVQPWSCAAAPIHDPQTQAILGLIDITGGDDVASPQALGMVRAAARMAEAELARIAMTRTWVSTSPAARLSGWSPSQDKVEARPASVALGGFLTNCRVESTMRSAYERGFNVFTLTDCVAAPSMEEHDNAIAEDYPRFSHP